MIKRLLLGSLFVLLTVTLAYGGDSRLDGQVHETMSNKGISGLTVKLIPPKASPMPEKITFTDHNGEFHFLALDRGNYLLEVYQGVTLLHREVVALDRELRRDIALARK